jgi:uncharacterized protein (TIGR03067 family)
MKLLVIVSAGLLLLRVPSGPEEAEGVGPLQGVWHLVATADAGRADRGSADCTMTIRCDGSVVMRLGELATNEGTVRVNRDDAPRHIDLDLRTGVVLGVFVLEGDSLIICCDEAGKPRPTAITPSGTQWVERWKRARR